MSDLIPKIQQAGKISWFYFFFTWRTTLIGLIWISTLWLTVEKHLGLFQFHAWSDIMHWLYTERWALTAIGSIIYLLPANLSTIVLTLTDTPYEHFQLITKPFSIAQRSKKLLKSVAH